MSAVASKPITAPPAAYCRDRLTWLTYFLYGFWSLAWGLFAPLMPFIRDDMHLDYATAALHFSALAVGLLCAGVTGPSILRRISRPTAIWAGTGAMALATLSIGLSSHHFGTILAALVVGFGGSIAGQSLIAGLTDRFPNHRATAIAELVMVNSMFAAAIPLMVAAIAYLKWSWKLSVIAPVAILAMACLATRFGGRNNAWSGQSARAAVAGGLPASYWLYFAIVFLTVAAEWSVAFWCPDYAERVLKFSRPDACSALSVFLFAMLSGRVIGTRIASKASTNLLLLGATILASAGFFLFWSCTQPMAVYAGLIILGLGLSNCYPLALAAAINLAPEKTSQATAKTTISTGSAILLAPLVLGLAADKIGIAQAYGIVAFLLVLAVLTAGWSAKIMKA